MEASHLRRGLREGVVAGTLALGLLAALGGCDTTRPFLDATPLPSAEPVTQVETMWSNNLVTTQDWVNNGRSVTGLSGCVYLLGVDGTTPVAGDGELVISLLHDVPHAGTEGPSEIAHWQFDAAILKGMLKNDRIGPCYPVFLPWPDHMPVFSQVQLKVRYNQPNRVPVYSVSQAFTLNSQQAPNQPQPAATALKPHGR